MTLSKENVVAAFITAPTENDRLTGRPVATGDIQGQCLPFFVPSQMLLRPEKVILKHKLKQKSYPLKIYFVPRNLKTWLQACLQV